MAIMFLLLSVVSCSFDFKGEETTFAYSETLSDQAKLPTSDESVEFVSIYSTNSNDGGGISNFESQLLTAMTSMSYESDISCLEQTPDTSSWPYSNDPY